MIPFSKIASNFFRIPKSDLRSVYNRNKPGNGNGEPAAGMLSVARGNITGMGIRYGNEELRGSRLFDFEIFNGIVKTRLYSLLDYTKFTLLIFSENKVDLEFPNYVKVIQIYSNKYQTNFWTNDSRYINQAILVRPDSYIESYSCNEFKLRDSIYFFSDPMRK